MREDKSKIDFFDGGVLFIKSLKPNNIPLFIFAII